MGAWIGMLVGVTLLSGCGASRLAVSGPPDPFATPPRFEPPVHVSVDVAPAPAPVAIAPRDERAFIAPVRSRTATVSMGFVGDAPLGPNVPHVQPSWTRPFPASWLAGYGTSFRRRR